MSIFASEAAVLPEAELRAPDIAAALWQAPSASSDSHHCVRWIGHLCCTYPSRARVMCFLHGRLRAPRQTVRR